jgi:SAM-dependent methyltransferase
MSYDLIAEHYDILHSDNSSHIENMRTIDLLKYVNGSVLDIGCGTGLLLDYLNICDYVGIDPSKEMLRCMKKKHQSALVFNEKFEDFYFDKKFDLIVSLFGSISYVDPSFLRKIYSHLNINGRYFLMFYSNEYTPITYIKSGVYIEHYKYKNELGIPNRFLNYLIVEN